MTKNKIPCEVIQDLLPLYIDGLTSGVTDEEIRIHLDSCSECRSKYDCLTADMSGAEHLHQEETEKEIDYLKKIKQSGSKKLLIGFCSALALILVCAGLKLYVLGWEWSTDVRGVNFYVSEQTVHFDGCGFNKGNAYKGYKIKTRQDGSQELIVYQCKKSPLHQETQFKITVPLKDIEKELTVYGASFTPDGTHISDTANMLFEKKNPYIGQMSANADLTMMLGIDTQFGEYENELFTEKRPYKWMFHFKYSADEQRLNTRMTAYACILLAVVENADEIGWSYPVDSEGKERRYKTVTGKQASKILGRDVKSFGESPESIQKMLDKLNPYWV